jgi:hypothetical protein
VFKKKIAGHRALDPLAVTKRWVASKTPGKSRRRVFLWPITNKEEEKMKIRKHQAS